MFQFFGDVASGGWNALQNVANTVGQGASYVASGFFPSPQRKEPVVSEIVEPAGAGGLSFRPTAPDAPSVWETDYYRDMLWRGSPYEANLAVGVKQTESKQLEQTMGSGKKTQPIIGFLGDVVDRSRGFMSQASEIRTLADDFMQLWGIGGRAPIPEGRRETGNSRGAVRNTDPNATNIRNVVETIRGFTGEFLNQIKGLFNVGFGSPTGAQPAFAIRHEVQPTPKLTAGLVVVAAVIIFLILRKK